MILRTGDITLFAFARLGEEVASEEMSDLVAGALQKIPEAVPKDTGNHTLGRLLKVFIFPLVSFGTVGIL